MVPAATRGARLQWAVLAAAALTASVSARSAFDTLDRTAPPLSDAEARRPYERKYGGGGGDGSRCDDAEYGCRVGSRCTPLLSLALLRLRCRCAFYELQVRGNSMATGRNVDCRVGSRCTPLLSLALRPRCRCAFYELQGRGNSMATGRNVDCRVGLLHTATTCTASPTVPLQICVVNVVLMLTSLTLFMAIGWVRCTSMLSVR